jgi:hypothetical protein
MGVIGGRWLSAEVERSTMCEILAFTGRQCRYQRDCDNDIQRGRRGRSKAARPGNPEKERIFRLVDYIEVLQKREKGIRGGVQIFEPVAVI